MECKLQRWVRPFRSLPSRQALAVTLIAAALTGPAAAQTGLSSDILQQVVGHIGGEGSLGQFASLLEQAQSSGMLGKLEGMAGSFFNKS